MAAHRQSVDRVARTATLKVSALGGGRYQVACGGSCGRAGVHVVTIGAEIATCDCPAGAFRRACKHVKAVTDHLMLEQRATA